MVAGDDGDDGDDSDVEYVEPEIEGIAVDVLLAIRREGELNELRLSPNVATVVSSFISSRMCSGSSGDFWLTPVG